MTDKDRFNLAARLVRHSAEDLITEFFGERCTGHEPGCEICERWKHLDALLANPFDEDEVTLKVVSNEELSA